MITNILYIDGTLYAVKIARTVWTYTKSERIVRDGEEVDKTELDYKITEAEHKVEEDYNEETWEPFAEALAAAKEVNENEEATQEEVNQALEALEEACDKLVELVKDGELVTTEAGLRAAIAQGSEISEIYLTDDIDVTDILWIRRAITINGNGYTINSNYTTGTKSAIKIDSLGSGTKIKNLKIEATGYTNNVIYVSTATGVTISDCNLHSKDNLAMGINFDKTSSGIAIDNTITGRKGIGADTTEVVTIKNNTINFSNFGIELHDGNNANTVTINNETEENDLTLAKQYTVSGNTYNAVE